MRRILEGVLALSLMVCLPYAGYAAHKQKAASSHSKGKEQTTQSSASPGQFEQRGGAKHAIITQNRIEKQQVTVAAELLNAEQTTDLFEVDLLRKGVQPATIQMHNASGQTYQFRKAQVDEHLIPAREVARYAYSNPILIGVRLLKWVVVGIPLSVTKFFLDVIPLLDFSELDGVNPRPLMNHEIRADFLRAEIPDAVLPPNGSVEGFVFLQPLEHPRPFRITLINTQTHVPLEFEIPVSTPSGEPAVSTATPSQ